MNLRTTHLSGFLMFFAFVIVGCKSQKIPASESQDGKGVLDDGIATVNAYRAAFTKGESSDLQFFFADQVKFFGAFRELDPESIKRVSKNWDIYPRTKLVEAYGKMIKSLGSDQWENGMNLCQPISVVAHEYHAFPEDMPPDVVKSDDLILDFRMTETVFNRSRATFDEVPVSVFRKTNKGYKIVAQIGYIP